MNVERLIDKCSRYLRGVRTRRMLDTQRDRALTRRLYAAVERDLEAAAVQGLHFYTYKGTVTVYGTIRHEQDRDLLLTLMRQIPGVKGVVLQVQVLAPRPSEAERIGA